PERQKRGENVAARGIVAPPQKLGHRVKPCAHVVRKKNPDQQRVDDPGIPAERRDHDALRVPGPDLRDEMLAADHRRDHGSADHVPRQSLVAQEIVFRVPAGTSAGQETDHNRKQNVGRKYGEVETVQLDARVQYRTSTEYCFAPAAKRTTPFSKSQSRSSVPLTTARLIGRRRFNSKRRYGFPAGASISARTPSR